jgi:hypothetical protein
VARCQRGRDAQRQRGAGERDQLFHGFLPDPLPVAAWKSRLGRPAIDCSMRAPC